MDETNALNVSEQLQNLTSNGNILVPQDIEKSVGIIDEIVGNLESIEKTVRF